MKPEDIFCELNWTYGAIKAFCAGGETKLWKYNIMPIKKKFATHKEFMRWFRTGTITIINDDNETESGVEK